MYSFTGQGVISLKPSDACKKKTRSIWPLSRLKTVNLECRLSLSVAWLVKFWFKSLQFLQDNLFLLAVCTHKVPLYLCSIFCSRSLVQVSTASYRVWSMEHTPNCASVIKAPLGQETNFSPLTRVLFGCINNF